MPPDRPAGGSGVPGRWGPGRAAGAGSGAKMKPSVSVATVPSGFVTVTVTAPGAWAGVVAVIVVLFTTVTFAAAPPSKWTVAPATKPLPVIVTAVPPVGDPVCGVTCAMPGRAKAVRCAF